MIHEGCSLCLREWSSRQDLIYISLYYGSHGKVNENVAPIPFALFFAQILPLWASIIFFVMYNPRPIPFSDMVVNLVNNLGNISILMPFPLSLTDITTHFWSFINSTSDIT